MLLRYTVENFLSFNGRAVFSMIPGKGSLKKDHRSTPINDISALKASIILGANASGKSNLIKAIDFGRRMVVRGQKDGQILDYKKYRLDTDSAEKDSRMEFEIQAAGKNYAYGFVFNNQFIVEEWLYEISRRSQKMIFERSMKSDPIFNLTPMLKKNEKEEDQQFIRFVAKGTPDNQLFLTELRTRKVQDNVSDIQDAMNVYNWFFNQLKVIFPSTRYKEGIQSEITDNEKLHAIYEELLKYFGTGISGVRLTEIEQEKMSIPLAAIEDIKENLLNLKSEGVRTILTVDKLGLRDTYIISRNRHRNDIKVEKFMTEHKTQQGDIEVFDTGDESDGTNRIIDFIPLIIDLLKGDNVFIIDEMERSLHPNLTYDIFDLFLDFAAERNSQLIATTHESSLLTQKLFRKDEIWFVVKDDRGASRIYSLEDYNVRFDKEIRRDYLLGRFKAIPRIGNRYELSLNPADNA